MRGPLNLTQIALTCALGLEARISNFRWRDNHPKLRAWFDAMTQRPSVARTVPA